MIPRFPLDQRTQGGLRVFREIIVPSVRIGRSNIYTLKGERQRSTIERCRFFYPLKLTALQRDKE